MKTLKALSIFILTATLILLIPSCAVNPVTGKRQVMLMSEDQEIALGAQYNPTVISTFGTYQDEALLKLIKTKGIEMGKISHRPQLQYHFTILDSPVINAFAVPGGYIYLTRGILAQFNNEAELMGVLGHEMGHITARHTAQQQTRQQLGQLALAAGMIASPEVAQFANEAMQAMQLLFLSFSRANEREADRLGVEYSSKIGYDSHKMADFFNVLNKMSMASSHGGVPTFMSTHPDPGDRYNSVNLVTKEWQSQLPGTKFAVNTNNYLKLIDGIVYGEDPRQGFVENNNFYHPDLRFKFPIPMGWKLVNSPLQVQITPEEGNAAMIFTLSQEKNLQAAAQKTLSELKFTVVENKNIKVNGFNTIKTISQRVSQSATGETTTKLLSYFIQKAGNIYVFHGVSTGNEFAGFIPAFESTMNNFALLKESSKLNVKPNRIRVKTVQRTGTLADAFKYYKVPQKKYKEIALLNNMELTDRVSKGKLIKTVGK